MIYLNLGSGNDYREGYINIDQNNLVKCDKVVDLKTKLPFKSDTVDYILANHIIEHIPDTVKFMNECHRVLKTGCIMHIETPVAGTIAYWKDPTHVRGFVEQTFKYFADWNTCPAYGVKSWTIERLERVTDEATDENTILICDMKKC